MKITNDVLSTKIDNLHEKIDDIKEDVKCMRDDIQLNTSFRYKAKGVIATIAFISTAFGAIIMFLINKIGGGGK